MDLIQFYARLVATLHPCLEDIATTLVEILIKDLRFQIKKKDQVHIHSKLKNVRFIGTHITYIYTDMHGRVCGALVQSPPPFILIIDRFINSLFYCV